MGEIFPHALFSWESDTAGCVGTGPDDPAMNGGGELSEVRDRGRISESRLENGIRVLSEAIPGVRSAAVGLWVRQGAAHEDPGIQGASHLLEHLVFKGTQRRTARDVALALEGLGGSLDAFTSREHTSYQARVLDEHLPEAVEVLSDVVLSPLLRDRDLELEREVVLEELSTVEDTPDDLVFELHGARLWSGHPYGRSVLGDRRTVSDISGSVLRRLHEDRYRRGHLIVAAAGNVEHGEVVGLVEEHFGGVRPRGAPPEVPEPDPAEGGEEGVPRDTAQTHVVFGTGVPGHSDPRRWPLALLSSAFGGGMSSRLFQTVREELALAYSVYSYQSFYARGGVSGVYVGTRPGWADRAVEVIRDEFRRLADEGLPPEELEQTKRQIKGQIMLSLESTGARLYRLAGFALYEEPFLTLDELLARVDAVSAEEIAEVARRFYNPDRQLVLRLGPGER